MIWAPIGAIPMWADTSRITSSGSGEVQSVLRGRHADALVLPCICVCAWPRKKTRAVQGCLSTRKLRPLHCPSTKTLGHPRLSTHHAQRASSDPRRTAAGAVWAASTEAASP